LIIRFYLAKITMHLILICAVQLAVPVLAGCKATVEKGQLRADSSSCPQSCPGTRQSSSSSHPRSTSEGLEGVFVKTMYVTVTNC